MSRRLGPVAEIVPALACLGYKDLPSPRQLVPSLDLTMAAVLLALALPLSTVGQIGDHFRNKN